MTSFCSKSFFSQHEGYYDLSIQSFFFFFFDISEIVEQQLIAFRAEGTGKKTNLFKTIYF